MKTTKEQHEQIKQLIKYLKKMNGQGRIKVMEVDRKADIKENKYNEISGATIKGEFIDVALYEYK